jgi:hypothetical protein
MMFLSSHWPIVTAIGATIAGIGAAIGAGVGWYITYRGWGVVHRNAIDLEKRKAELTFTSDQIRYLYGPLTALCETRDAAMRALMKQLAPGRTNFFDGADRTPEEKRQWRLWRTEVMHPTVVKMEESILQNAHLIEGTEMPASFVRLMTHVAAYKAVIKNWADVIEKDKEAGTQAILSQEHTSVMNFPNEFHDDVARTFKELKAKQCRLIASTRVQSDGPAHAHPGA